MGGRCRLGKWVSTAMIAGALYGSLGAGDAAAKTPESLRIGERKMFFLGGLGGSFAMAVGGPGLPHAFRLHQEIGGHLTGKAYGPALSGILQESVGTGPHGGMNLGVKFAWDIPVIRDTAFYIAPAVSLGYGFLSAGGYTVHAADGRLPQKRQVGAIGVQIGA